MPWWLAAAALLTALLALWMARRTARRLDQLTHAYWELRYQVTRLRGGSGEPGADPGDGPVRVAPAPDAAAQPGTFISLASLKGGAAGRADAGSKAGPTGE
jgi:hypothetical protein